MKNLMWSFSPWVVFLLGVRIGGVYWGAAIGLAVALVVLAIEPLSNRLELEYEIVAERPIEAEMAVFAGECLAERAKHREHRWLSAAEFFRERMRGCVDATVYSL